MTTERQRDWLLGACSMLLLLTALRNISAAYYGLVSLFFMYFIATRPRKFFVVRRSTILFDLFLGWTFFVIAWSFIYMMSSAPLVGVPRILLMPLFALVLFRWVDSPQAITRLIRVGFASFVLGALTLAYQVLFGPISWFADASSRAGLDRYSTILGSLTIFGSIVGYAFLVLFQGPRFSPLTRLALGALMLAAAFFSLQKAAVLTLLIAGGLGLVTFLVGRARLSSKVAVLIVGAFLTVSAYEGIQAVPIARRYFNAAVVSTFGLGAPLADASHVVRNYQSLDEAGLSARLYDRLARQVQVFGPIVWFGGVGMQGAAGGMGMEGDMVHNSFGDLLLMGGPVFLLLFLALYAQVQLRLLRNIARPNSLVLFNCNLIFLANMGVAAVVPFQPALSFLFWLSVVYALQFLRPHTATAAAAALSPMLIAQPSGSPS